MNLPMDFCTLETTYATLLIACAVCARACSSLSAAACMASSTRAFENLIFWARHVAYGA